MNKSTEDLHNFCLRHRFRLTLNKSKADSFSKKITAELTEEFVTEKQSVLKKKKEQNIIQLAAIIQNRLSKKKSGNSSVMDY